MNAEQQYIGHLRKVIPQFMREMPNWTQCFQVAKATPGFSGKIPMGDHGKPETWFTFEDAIHSAWRKNDAGVWVREEDAPLKAGRRLGFQFLNTDLLPIDLDHVRAKTGEISKEAMSMISDLATYTEISVSGTGFHCIGRGVIRQKQLTTQHIQFWNPRLGVPRFLWITGDVIGDAFKEVRQCGEAFQIFASHPRMYSVKMQEELRKFDPEQAASLPPEAAAPIEQQPRERGKQKTQRVNPDFDVYDYIAFNGMKIANECDDPEVGHCIRMTTCPNHGDNTAHAGHNETTCNFIYPTKDGGFAYHCHSTGCHDGQFTVHDAIRKLAELNGPYPKPIFEPPKKGKTEAAPIKRRIEVSWGDSMVPEVVRFLVPEFVPLHQATAFSGEMDTRKSTLALNVAAAGSLFHPWFMGTENEHSPFSTLVAADEDTYTTTVLPRFIAAGGYRPCLGCLSLEVQCEQETEDGLKVYSTSLGFDEHLNLLGEAILTANKTRPFKVGLLINDPIISFFGNKSYNNPQDARDIMRGLKKLCEELQFTIINICHFNKTQGLTAKQKTAGSKALIEAHRQAWAFDLMEDDPKITLIAPIKHNLLKDSRSYKITTDSKTIEWQAGDENGEPIFQKAELGVIRFVGYTTMTADERIEEKESKDKGSRKELKRAILDVLKDGPKPAGHIKNELREMASIPSIERAAKSLVDDGVLRRSGTNRNNMTWELVPETEQEQIRFDEENNT